MSISPITYHYICSYTSSWHDDMTQIPIITIQHEQNNKHLPIHLHTTKYTTIKSFLFVNCPWYWCRQYFIRESNPSEPESIWNIDSALWAVCICAYETWWHFSEASHYDNVPMIWHLNVCDVDSRSQTLTQYMIIILYISYTITHNTYYLLLCTHHTRGHCQNDKKTDKQTDIHTHHICVNPLSSSRTSLLFSWFRNN